MRSTLKEWRYSLSFIEIWRITILIHPSYLGEKYCQELNKPLELLEYVIETQSAAKILIKRIKFNDYRKSIYYRYNRVEYTHEVEVRGSYYSWRYSLSFIEIWRITTWILIFSCVNFSTKIQKCIGKLL